MLTIPYFEVHSIGPFEPWGLLVATGVLISIVWSIKRAKRLELDVDALTSLAIGIVVGGFIGARLVHVFFYHWADFEHDLGSIFKIWEGGLSSFGGLFGATIAGVWYLRKRHLNPWKYGDCAIFAILPGWTVARLGCFAIHDHPGGITDFILGVQMKLAPVGSDVPALAARHDLGLYDAILTLCIVMIFLWLDRKTWQPGLYLSLGYILYAVPHFFLDFLRANDLSWSDTRYIGLTPAQYGSIILVILGGWLFWARKQDAT